MSVSIPFRAFSTLPCALACALVLAACGAEPRSSSAPPEDARAPRLTPARPDVVDRWDGIASQDALAACPPATRMVFRVDGTFVPDMTTFVRAAHGKGDAVRVVQEPAPGAEILEPGALEVVIGVAGARDGVERARCSTVLEVVDASPPEIAIVGVEDGARIFVDDFVPPQVLVLDDVDREVTPETLLDGAPWCAGDAIGVGSHELVVRAQDEAGNLDVKSVVFDVSAVRAQEVLAAVTSFGCSELEPGVVSFGAELHVGATAFDAKAIDLYTVHLWALDEHNEPMHDDALRIAGSTDPDTGGYAFETAQASYARGLWRLTFEGGGLTQCPGRVLLTGGAHRGDEDDTDFAVVLAVDDALAEVRLAAAMNDDPAMAPPPASATPSCRWRKETIDEDNDAPYARIDRGLFHNLTVSLDVNHGIPWGRAWAKDGIYNAFTTVADAAVVRGRASHHVWLEGPESCGCEARVTCTFLPEMRVRVEMNSPSAASGIGVMDVRSEDCALEKTARGGLQIGDNTPEKVNVTLGASIGADGPAAEASVEFEVELANGDVDEELFDVGAPSPSTVDRRDVMLHSYAMGKLKVSADSSITDIYAESEARLFGFRRGVTVRGQCGALEETFRF